MADTYKKGNSEGVSVFKGQETVFFQYKVNKVYPIEAYFHCCYSILDDIDVEILSRIIASHAIVLEQLYCYLHLQGIDMNLQELVMRIHILQSKSMIKRGLITNGKRKNFLNFTYYENIEFFEATKDAEYFLRNRAIPGIRKKEYVMEYAELPWHMYVRASIMWNQIILKLLLTDDNIKDFNMHFLYRKRNVKMSDIYVPLLVNTEHKVYVFEFVRGVDAGKDTVKEKYQKWSSCLRIHGRPIHLVFLCENEYHMEMMAASLKEEVEKIKMPVYFSHDDLWFCGEKGKIMRLCMLEGRLK